MLNTGCVRYALVRAQVSAGDPGVDIRQRCAHRRAATSAPAQPNARARSAARSSAVVVSSTEMRHGVVVDPVQQESCGVGVRHEGVGAAVGLQGQGVEVVAVHDGVAAVGGRLGEHPGASGDRLGDLPQPVRAVVHGVHRRHHGQQHLRGADVAGRLLAADVLLARLQREPVGGVPGRILRDADEPAGQLALQPARARPCSRRADRRSPSARRTAAWCRPRRRRRARPGEVISVRASRSAATTASAPAAFAAAITGGRIPDAPGGAGVLHEDAEAVSCGIARRTSPGRRTATSTRSMPSASARLASTALVCGNASASTRKMFEADFEARRASSIPSTTAVLSSSIDAFAVSSPVRSVTMVWKLISASSRPCEISGWYGVYAVYQLGFSSTLRLITAGVIVS